MDIKKKVLLTGGAALVSLSPMLADDASAASKSIKMQAIVLRAIQLTQLTSLNFGTFSVTGASTAVQAPGGGITYNAGLNAIGAPANSDAVVQIKASKGYAIDLSVAAATATIVNGTAKTMKVNAFKLDEAAGMGAFASGSNVTITLSANTASFEVGATLNVGAGQAAGTYTGTFTVNANYQ